ncbi:peptidase M3 [candidate division KSB1 bacterium]|nr:peptidase M3 [candidate division KSB1 bacterium]
MRNRLLYVILVLIVSLVAFKCGENEMEKQLRNFIDSHVDKVKPLMKEMNETYWQATITGNEEDFEKVASLEIELRTIYSDTADFALIRKFKDEEQISSPLLQRQVEILYSSYLGNQIDPALMKKIVRKSSEIENKFSVFRGTMSGKKVTDNDIKKILSEETDSSVRRAAWFASKQVGGEVASNIIELVKLRNEAAQHLGFENYYVLSLTLTEQKLEDLNQIFDELAQLTEEPFRQLKFEMDSLLAHQYAIAIGGLMPWHYHDPFFQEGPQVYDVNLDKFYQDHDIKELAATFYNGIDLNVDDILARSDLYEKEGKNQHAYCTDIDREGDVRILCNLKNNEKWMDTILHELGHAVYDKYMDPDLPFLLREPAHSFTTEAVAQLFGRLSRNANWIQGMTGISDEERKEIAGTVFKSMRLQQLIFARWCQVMFRFEQALYQNPDQDLNKLWWDLVEKYQMIKRPPQRNAPDWAAKIHFTIVPVYYHNYMLGELLASQMHHYIVFDILDNESDDAVSYINQTEIGDFLKEEIFSVGAKYEWNEMIKHSTGEYLTAKYFVQQFVK